MVPDEWAEIGHLQETLRESQSQLWPGTETQTSPGNLRSDPFLLLRAYGIHHVHQMLKRYFSKSNPKCNDLGNSTVHHHFNISSRSKRQSLLANRIGGICRDNRAIEGEGRAEESTHANDTRSESAKAGERRRKSGEQRWKQIKRARKDSGGNTGREKQSWSI